MNEGHIGYVTAIYRRDSCLGLRLVVSYMYAEVESHANFHWARMDGWGLQLPKSLQCLCNLLVPSVDSWE